MAKNDVVLLDGIVDERIENNLPSTKRDEAFEYLSFEQILKEFDFSKDEILSGSVDGRNDGGIDGFFIIINGNILTEPESFLWPRSGVELKVNIITCKHHDTFKQAPLDNLVATISELLDFSIENEQLNGDYSENVLECRNNLKIAYRKISSKLNEFNINFYYASRGDTTQLGESIVSRSEQVKMTVKESFGEVKVNFEFIGATELIEKYRKKQNYSLELPISEVLSNGERYVVLANLNHYKNFITDDEGKLRRYLFDSNVRDFMGLNRVNEDIKKTLECEDKNAPDFWWLNNGVTILVTSARLIGKTMQMENIQIVNGLQTTESIYRYFNEGFNDFHNRSVLIKVIVSENQVVRDSIIEATNNQTNVEISSLHATDKIQRDIEDILLKNELYYERRKNYYINMGYSAQDIFTPLYLASGYVNLLLKLPLSATILKSRFMQSESYYNMVFSEKDSLLVWPKIALILKKTDSILIELKDSIKGKNEKFLKTWRHIVSLLTISRLLNKYDFNINDLIKFDIKLLTKNEIETSWDFIKKNIENSKNWNINKRNSYINLFKDAGEKFDIKNYKIIERNMDFNPKGRKNSKNSKIEVSEEFMMKVEAILPEQPWKPGVHKLVMKELNCSFIMYNRAVELLIEKGNRYKQINGVLYDNDNNVISFDKERVDPDTLLLKLS